MNRNYWVAFDFDDIAAKGVQMQLRGCLGPSLTRHCQPLLVLILKKIPLRKSGGSGRRADSICCSNDKICGAFLRSSLQMKMKPSPVSVRKGYNSCAQALWDMSCNSTHNEKQIVTEKNVSRRSKKKARQESPETMLLHKLNMCSKNGDLKEALRLYDDARRDEIKISVQNYNSLLYLCSGSSVNLSDGVDDGSEVEMGLRRGAEILEQMRLENVAPNEATFTNAARLAAARDDPEMAFSLVKQMPDFGFQPRLRSYGPALFSFCKNGQAEKAYEVDAHMRESEVVAEEPELAALLKLSSDIGNADKVYEMLHRLRATVRQVSESTAGVIEKWFLSKAAAEAGDQSLDIEKIQNGAIQGGGGWHGQGWLRFGEWKVKRTEMNEKGVCQQCGEKLVCIDIDPKETEKFASSLASLACERELRTGFIEFQDWLKRLGPYDAVVDGANVSLVNQKNFNFLQLKIVVEELRKMSPTKKLPLIVLHRSRVIAAAQNPDNKLQLETWRRAGALYATPTGSNDDWYWLYAAVSSKCLLVTNDEMRDHLFQLLGNSFFPIWKEKHQIRLKVTARQGPTLHMPPTYSIVIQESEQGSWHVPTTTGDDLEAPRQWLCATRPS